MVTAESIVVAESQNTLARNLIVIRVGVFATAWLAMLLPGDVMKFEIFYGLSALLLGYLAIEVYCLPEDPYLPRILNPIVLASIGSYAFSMGAILNFFTFANRYTSLDFGFLSRALNREIQYVHFTLTLACSAAVLTWIAYHSKIGMRLYNLYVRLIPSARFLRGDFDSKRVLFIVVAAIATRLLLFKLGLHGRMVSSAMYDATKGYLAGTEVRHLGTLCYVAIALTFLGHARNPSHLTSGLRWVILGSEAVFGFLYAARSTIVYPFLIAFITQSYCDRRVSRLHLGLSFVALIFAMSIGNEFKYYGIESGYQEEMGVIDIIVDFAANRDKYAAQQNQNESLTAFVVNFARNKSKVAECAAAIQYASTSKASGRNWFYKKSWNELFWSPIHGFFPRLVTGVPRPPWGLQFKNAVLRRNVKARYSIGFSPIGFLYLAGGTAAVLVGALCYGVALSFTQYVVRRGDLGFLLFLALMSILTDVHTVVPESIINCIRYLIFLPATFWILFKR